MCSLCTRVKPFDTNCRCHSVPNEPESFASPAIWCFCSGLLSTATAVRRIDQTLNSHQRDAGQGPLRPRPLDRESPGKDIPTASPVPTPTIPLNGFSTATPAGRWSGTKLEKRTAHGPLRTDDTVLQVAVTRLLGYRWPAELDAGMELADEQREWVRHCETLHAFADKDGIVCIPPVRR